MTPQQAAAEIKRRLAEIERFRTEDLPEIIGVEAVRHYNESFVKEGATDRSFQKWPDVKRRDPQSPWYGFSLGANTPKPKADENGMANSTAAASPAGAEVSRRVAIMRNQLCVWRDASKET